LTGLNRTIALARACARAARGAEGPLATELRRAVKGGVPLTLLREALLQTYLFAGFPRAITALVVLDREAPTIETLREKPMSQAAWRRRGERLCKIVYGPDYPALMRNMKRAHPDLADWILVEGYGKTLSRPFLSLRERELIAVATLAALAAWRQLPSHLAGALRAGASRREIADVLHASRGAVSTASVHHALSLLKAVP
jgi:alkylhydroperoxidase/carboxymuconolactone decarboxylase family protein YurZ